jgi:NhaA family Na+:H+ antiporter
MSAHDHADQPLVEPSEFRDLTVIEQLAERALRPFQLFARRQAAGGLVLLACTGAALALANSRWADLYARLLHEPFGVRLGHFSIDFDLHHWINDGLMALFFFAVGLEIKRELLVGELAEPRKALLPIAGAVGGMVVPAGLYAWVNAGGPGLRGWGIPMATDIAFALGALVLLGPRAPEPLRVFLAALAIVDDLGAVLVIALFYTSGLEWRGIAIGLVFLLGLVAANRAGVHRPLPWIILGVGLWYGLLLSGVHATLAGVLVAMTVPARTRIKRGALSAVVRRAADRLEMRPGDPVPAMDPRRFATITYLRRALVEAKTPLERFEHAVNPWVTFAVMPMFAFFNAGIALDASALATLGTPVPLGIVLGLVVGKQVGVFIASWLAVRSGLAALPESVTWRQLYGVAWLTGIGFTMSLFISGLAFADTSFETPAKLGILVASGVSAIGGVLILLRSLAASDSRLPAPV